MNDRKIRAQYNPKLETLTHSLPLKNSAAEGKRAFPFSLPGLPLRISSKASKIRA
jgi:hypothetical protein